MWKRKSAAASRKDLKTFLDEGAEIEGKCTFTGTVMMNGKCQGEIASSDTLIIGESGTVKANIEAATLIVHGEVTGNIHASVRVELRGKARVFGDVETPVMVVEEGAHFEGHCRMTDEASGKGTVVPIKKG
jgi:cytoskeletal protein CcmA (bactofilin family)